MSGQDALQAALLPHSGVDDRLGEVLEFTESIWSASDLDEVVERTADAVRSLLRAELSGVHLSTGRGTYRCCIGTGDAYHWREIDARSAFHGGVAMDEEPIVLADASAHPTASLWSSAHPSLGPYISVPLVNRSHSIGTLCAASAPGGRKFTADDRAVLGFVGRQAAVALRSARLCTCAATEARLTERQRIAQSLHESLAQRLFMIGLELKWCRDHLELDDDARGRVQEATRLASSSAEELRNAIFTLRSQHLADDAGLVDALHEQIDAYQRRTGVEVVTSIEDGLPAVTSATGDAILRVMQEALSNVLNHAEAKAVLVSLRATFLEHEADHLEPTVCLVVQDDGVGLDGSAVRADNASGPHFGIETMRRLAEGVGGTVEVLEADGGGVIVRASLPCPLSEIPATCGCRDKAGASG